MMAKSRQVFDLDDPGCLYEVCRLKYQLGRSEREIARYFGFDQHNRTQIRKALKRAETLGIVIRPPAAIIRPGGMALDNRPLESRLAEKFNLAHVQIVEGFSEAYVGDDLNMQNIVLDRMTKAAAVYFDSLMMQNPRPRTVCVNWGYAMRLFTSHVLDLKPAQRVVATSRRNQPCVFLPMVGIMGTGNRTQVAEREAYQLALELARKYDAVPRHLPCPAIIRDPDQARIVEQLGPVRSSLELLREAQVAVTGIGFVDDRDDRYADMTIVKQQLVTADEVKVMRQRGAVGEIANWFFDAQGNELDGSNKTAAALRPIGLGLPGLRRIIDRKGTVIAICGSDARRVPPLRACLACGKKLITALFTDHLTAQALVEDD